MRLRCSVTIQKGSIGDMAGSECSRVGQTQFELKLVEDPAGSGNPACVRVQREELCALAAKAALFHFHHTTCLLQTDRIVFYRPDTTASLLLIAQLLRVQHQRTLTDAPPPTHI